MQLNLCENINKTNFWNVISKLAEEAIKHDSMSGGFDGFTTFYSYVSKECAKVYFKDKGFDNTEVFTERMQKIFNRFRDHEFYEGLCLTPEALSVIGIAQNLKNGDEKDGKIAIDFTRWLDETKCNLGEYRSNENYSKLVYFLYLAFRNINPNEMDSFNEHFINVYSNNLLKFADILTRKRANFFVNFGNMHVSEILNTLSERFFEIVATDEEKALQMIESSPNLIEFYSNSYDYKCKFQEAMLKQQFGVEKYEDIRRKKGKERLEFYDFGIYKLQDINSQGETVMKLYMLKDIEETLNRNIENFGSGILSKLYSCKNIIEDIADLAMSGYITEASQFLDRCIELHDGNKDVILTVNPDHWYDLQEITRSITNILKICFKILF